MPNDAASEAVDLLVGGPAGGRTADGLIRRNFVLNVLDGAIFTFAMSFASRSTVLPLFVQRMGGGNLAIGLLPVLWTIGFNFPQLFIATHARQAPSKKRLVLQTGLIQRMPWLLLAAVTALFLWELPATWGLLLAQSSPVTPRPTPPPLSSEWLRRRRRREADGWRERWN